ncbi:PilZ domain-containing protein [Lutibacter sp. B2]|nr:PilZ domain-containing protein [Lutibacter sp. B2]
MEKNNLPSIGIKIEIELQGKKRTNSPKLISQVIDIMSDDIFMISVPTSQGMLVPITVGEKICIMYSQKASAVYGFDVRVLERVKKSELYCMKVEKAGEMFKIQRRNFFRLEAMLNAAVKKVDEHGNIELTIQGLTKDISGGGLCLIIKEPLKIGENVEVMLKTGEKNISVRGAVLRCVKYQEFDYKFELGITFKDIDEKMREEIISYIFEHQRKMRKKGLV